MDGLLDELKNVLSGLGQSSSPPPAPLPAPPPVEKPIEHPRVPPPPAPQLNDQSASNGAASDADFWKGNVLGWESPPEPPTPFPTAQTPPPPPPPSPPPSPSAPQAFPAPSLADQHFFVGPIEESAPTPAPAPPAYEKPSLEGSSFSLDTPFLENFSSPPNSIDDSPMSLEMPPAPAKAPPPPSPASMPPIILPPWTTEALIPEAPVAPGSSKRIPPKEKEPLLEKVAPQKEEANEESIVSLPGTVTSETKPRPSKDPLNVEGSESKPSGHIQIACLFPEGQERAGQQFVSRLRELGSKSRLSLLIEPVFVNAYAVSNPDPSAWIKSAKLSGAELMFIIGPKKDLTQFKPMTMESIHNGIKARTISLEQLGLRSLYTDILIELERGR